LLNPAKVKADHQALEEPVEVPLLVRKFGLHRRRTVILLNLLSAVLLAVSFPLVGHWFVRGQWYLAYVALVPWTLALAGGCSRRWTLFCSFLAGVLFWMTNYWLTWVTMLGYIPMVLFLGLYWLAAGAVVRAALRRNWPMWLVLPTVWVALEYARAYVLTGYPWYNLSLTQYRRVMLIQVSDLTGHYGVSFFVAMVNGAIADLCLAPWRARGDMPFKAGRRVITAAGAPLVVVAVLLSYGAWRIAQFEDTTRPGPVIGIVQESFPISFGQSVSARDRMDRHVSSTIASLKGTGCQLVVWPETMLPRWLNREMLDLDVNALAGAELRSAASLVLGHRWASQWSEGELRTALRKILHDGVPGKVTPARAYAEALAELAARLDCALLVGGATGHPNPDPIDEWDHWVIRNSALWFEHIRPTDPRYARRHIPGRQYAKRHPVPFSETIPLKHSWTWLHQQIRKLIPPEMPQLDAGTETTRFELKRIVPPGPGDSPPPPWRLAVVICFEGTFARRCREAVMENGSKAADILVNMSNDGWFVTPWQANVCRASTEHMQHLAQYCFRAVENRVPVVRSVNTGVSASIDSNGRIVTMLQREDGGTAYSGTILLGGRSTDGHDISSRPLPPLIGDRVRVDDRVSPYSLIGDVFAMLVSAGAIFIVFRLIRHRRDGRKEVRKCKAEKA